MPSIQTLHILNKMPDHWRAVECRRALQPGDALLLTESAVLALADRDTTARVYALASDAMARGVGNLAEEVTLVDFPAMVELTAQAHNVISW